MKKKTVIPLKLLKDSACARINQEVIRELENTVKKKAKYNNSKTEVDGIVFDSEKEANRYKELRLLLKAGVIGMLKMQQTYELNTDGSFSLKYLSDFEYIITATGKKVVEDVKGFRTREYLKKKRLMKKVYGIEIIEV